MKFSAAESDRFGVTIARLNIGTNWRSEFKDSHALFDHITAELRHAQENVVVLRYPSELARMPFAAQHSDRKILPAGCLMYWAADLRSYACSATKPAAITARQVGPAGEARRKLVAALEDSFRGYTNHYSANPLFDDALIVAGYREWAERTLIADSGTALVLEQSGGVIGVATIRDSHTDCSVREIELAGMISAEQGKGNYRHLLDAVASLALELGFSTLAISTQSHNIHVQRAWTAAGFRPVESVDTLHCVQTTFARTLGE